MEARPSKKKQALMQAGRVLFWKHGFRRITVEDICTEAGVSKMTFYRLFENKTELAKAIIDEVIDDSTTRFSELMNSPCGVDEKMQRLIKMKAEGTRDISHEFLGDLYSNPESGLSDYMALKTKETWESISGEFRKAQSEGWMRPDFKPEFLLAISYKMIELLGDERINSLYASPQELILEMTRMLVYGISPATGAQSLSHE